MTKKKLSVLVIFLRMFELPMNRHTSQTLSMAPHSNYLKKGKVVLLTHQITVKGVKMEAGVLDLEEEVDPHQAVVLQEEPEEQVVVLVVV